MELPQHLLESPFFTFPTAKDFLRAINDVVDDVEKDEVNKLIEKGLLPVTSKEALGIVFGVNAGIVWSFLNKKHKHYNDFEIPKGKGKTRKIVAPRVALKVVQKWLSVHLEEKYIAPPHVFGFVKGRSHIDAAKMHLEAKWVHSFDIQNFFPSTPTKDVASALILSGYTVNSADMIAELACFRGGLAQGAPTSPVLSNYVMSTVDRRLAEISIRHNLRLTRYADDIVFSSGMNEYPPCLSEEVSKAFEKNAWKLSDTKENFAKLPNRLKVHGLLVHGDEVRLTKGYRNKIRAYEYLLRGSKVGSPKDIEKMNGHINYANQVSR